MKITKRQLKRLIKETYHQDDQAIEQVLMNAFQDGQGSANAMELLDAYRNFVGPEADPDTFGRVVQSLIDRGWISDWEGDQSGNPEDAMLYLTQDDPRDQYMGENNMKITSRQLRRIIQEIVQPPMTVADLEAQPELYEEFSEDIFQGMGWIDPDYVADSWERYFERTLAPEALQYLKDTLEANGLLLDGEQQYQQGYEDALEGIIPDGSEDESYVMGYAAGENEASPDLSY